VAESPLAETTKTARSRFSILGDAQGATIRVTQQGPSATTNLFAIEVESRPYPLATDGVGT